MEPELSGLGRDGEEGIPGSGGALRQWGARLAEQEGVGAPADQERLVGVKLEELSCEGAQEAPRLPLTVLTTVGF